MWKNPIVPLQDIEHHKSLCTRLHHFVHKWEEIPHLLLCGPAGSGKKQIVHGLLLDKFGNAVLETSRDSSNPYYIVKRSLYHLEYFLTEKTGGHFTEELIAKIQFLNVATNSFHVVIVHGLHLVTNVIQSTIRQIMDQQYRTVRFIFVTRSLSNMRILKDRCLHIRVPALTKEECSRICKKRSSGFDDGLQYWETCNANLLDIFIHIEFELQKKALNATDSKKKGKTPMKYTDISDLLHALHTAIQKKNLKQIQNYVLQLYVVPLDAHTIFRLVTLHCIQQHLGQVAFQEIVRIGAYYDGMTNSVANVVYLLITFCYELTTVI